MCSGSEVGSYLRLIDLVYHSTLGVRVIKKKKISKGGLEACAVDTEAFHDVRGVVLVVRVAERRNRHT